MQNTNLLGDEVKKSVFYTQMLTRCLTSGGGVIFFTSDLITPKYHPSQI